METPNNRRSEHMRQKLIELREMENSIIIFGDLQYPIGRSSREKTSKCIEEIYNTTNQMP